MWSWNGVGLEQPQLSTAVLLALLPKYLLNRPRLCQTASKAGKDTTPCYLFKQRDSNPLQRCWWADTMSMVVVFNTSPNKPPFYHSCWWPPVPMPSGWSASICFLCTLDRALALQLTHFLYWSSHCFKCWGQERIWLLSYFTLLSLYESHLHPVTCHKQLLWQETKSLWVPICQFIYSVPWISVRGRNFGG